MPESLKLPDAVTLLTPVHPSAVIRLLGGQSHRNFLRQALVLSYGFRGVASSIVRQPTLFGKKDLFMLRRIRIGLLAAANATGLSRLIGASAWRQQRLLILCYHGISDSDVHHWNPSLFMYAEDFRRRLSLLREANCNVLGLSEALRRLEDGSLPPRSVVLTFDDGFHDFYRVAWPMLREFGYPATLYLTTHYVLHNLPVFDLALGYLLWKGRGQKLDWPGMTARPVSLDAAGRQEMIGILRTYAIEKELTTAQKDALLEELASRLGLDYDAFRRSRIVSLINENETRELSTQGADLQLHTHRHRTPTHQDDFSREIIENRDCMAALGLRDPEHFCYPNGLQVGQEPKWLEELGIKSAVTCRPELTAPGAARHLLPRVGDCFPFTETEFLAWVHGTAALLPCRGRAQEAAAAQQTQAEVERFAYSTANR
jgi:peptidoglycan/xylan/chitin deacetylase (PgdA/CDA1 family)